MEGWYRTAAVLCDSYADSDPDSEPCAVTVRTGANGGAQLTLGRRFRMLTPSLPVRGSLRSGAGGGRVDVAPR
jgi:hypothetical protein